jgi:TRAP-type C4-dicarboxylate transport system permease small subunit
MANDRGWWRRRADDVAILLLAAMFVTFIVQVAFRYVFNNPLSWTLEVCLTTWLWAVFWGASFCISDQEHVRFDMLYAAVRHPVRRVFAGISALAIVVAFIAALPGTWRFVSFLTIKKSPSLRLPLAWVFCIFLVFMVATIVIYGRRLIEIWKDKGEVDAIGHGGTP